MRYGFRCLWVVFLTLVSLVGTRAAGATDLQALVDEAHAKFKDVQEGANANYIPILDEVLAVMLMAGFYDEAGVWAYKAGLPAKTGVGGGIVAVVPGEMAIAAFSPRVNEAGNSIRSMRAIQYISEKLRASIFLGADD